MFARGIAMCFTTASLAAGGCTTRLEVVPLEAATATPVQGLVYYLPVGTIDITLVRTLTDCDGTDLKFDVQAETTVKYGPDRDRPLLINYEELNKTLKKTSLKATLNEDGTLKSLDSELSDKTGAVISNIGKSAVNIAKIAVSALTMAGAGKPEKESVCNPNTVKHIAQRNKLRGDIARKEAELAKLPTDKQAAARQEIDRLRGKLAPHEAFLQATSKHLALKPSFSTVKPQSDCSVDSSSSWRCKLKPAPEIATRWVEGSKSGFSDNAKEVVVPNSTTVYLRAVTAANSAPTGSLEPTSGRSALYYRQPSPVELTLARPNFKDAQNPGDCDKAEYWTGNADKCLVILSNTYLLPQAGRLVFLPLENGIFDSNVLKVSFHPSGALSTFEYVTESQAEAASATLAAITGSGSEIATEARTAETLGLEAQVKELELRQKLRTLRQQENSAPSSAGATP